MGFHIRVRPTALILKNDCILLVEYVDENGVHFNLPGGGAEPGETLMEGVRREVFEETCADVEVGPVAFVYEMAPHRQSGDYHNTPHNLSVVFECFLKEGSIPKMPDRPDLNQSGVKWVPLSSIDSIVLYPNMKEHIRQYAAQRSSIPLIEDHTLARYADGAIV